jgi:putative nucleotidyltransferase with HDIG domain
MAAIQLSSSQESSEAKARILIVDDEPSITKLLAQMLQHQGYNCLECQSGQDALHLMNTQAFDAVLCDIRMPGISGLDVLRAVRKKHPRLAFVMVTGVDDVQVGVQSMKEGAGDYLLKPLSLKAVLVSVHQVLERKKLESELENYRLHLEEMVQQRTAQLRMALGEIEKTYDETLQALAAALDLRDNETAGHSRRVMAYAVEIAKVLGCSKKQMKTIARGALLHDIGKIGIPDSILMKTGPLTGEEHAVMEAHVRVGYSLLSQIRFLRGAAEIILSHHERFDGTGYPQGLLAEEIPLGARIFAVADTLDALTSDRPYRQATTFALAREIITQQSGRQFDPAVVSAFLSINEGTWEDLRNEKGMIRSFGIRGWDTDVVAPAQLEQVPLLLEAMA